MPTFVSLLPSDLARARGGAERYAFELHDALTRELPGWTMRGLVAATGAGARHLPTGWTAVGGRRAARLSAGDAVDAAATLRHAVTGADVVLAHQWRTQATTTLRLACALRGPRLAVMDHGAGTRLGYALSWLPLPGAELGAHQSDFEAAISPLRARRHLTIRGGVDDRRFRPGPDPHLPSTDFVMVGRFVPLKGQLRFLEALPDGARATLVGPSDSVDPDYLDAVRTAAAARGVPVRFDLTDDELVSAYRDARHTVQVPVDLRRYEGAAPPELLGLTMLEAMSCGSVPICPSTGASAEFVRDGVTGLTYPQGDADALAAVLRDALARPRDDRTLRDGALAEAARWTWSGAARDLVGALGLAPAPDGRAPLSVGGAAGSA